MAKQMYLAIGEENDRSQKKGSSTGIPGRGSSKGRRNSQIQPKPGKRKRKLRANPEQSELGQEKGNVHYWLVDGKTRLEKQRTDDTNLGPPDGKTLGGGVGASV